MAYYEDGKKQFEAAIPILIIILLIVGVVLWKPELFAGVPIIGDWLAPKTIDVLVIADEASEKAAWSNHLTSDMARNVFGNPLNVNVVMPTGGTYTYASINDPGWLEARKVSVIILTGTQLTDSLQLTLREWVDGGGKLVVLGHGGIQDTGRWAELTRIIPVRCGLDEDCTTAAITVYSPTIHISDYESGMMECIDEKTPLTSGEGGITITDVNTVEGGNQIAYMDAFASQGDVTAGAVGDIHTFIVEKDMGMKGGKVLYLSFNPTTENISPAVEKSLVINTLAYISGKQCYKP
ncbi:hypothetical protein K8R43_06445 [archaeon]|nr:hypothetical protein [archaeon]